MEEKYCYIKFDFVEEENFNQLKRIFDLIRYAKNNSIVESDEYWLNKFPEEVLKKFYFSKDDVKPSFETNQFDDKAWHFYSLIESLTVNCEIEYIDCYKISTNEASLDFNPFSYPYGGISAMIILINSFNCFPRTADDGTGIYRIDFLKNGDFEINDIRNRMINEKPVTFGIFKFLKKLVLKK